MQTRFGKLSPSARLHERIVPLGELLGTLCRQWDNSEPPTAERVTKSQEKLASLMRTDDAEESVVFCPCRLTAARLPG